MDKYYVLSEEVNSIIVGDKEYNKNNSNLEVAFERTKEGEINPHKISINIQTKER